MRRTAALLATLLFLGSGCVQSAKTSTPAPTQHPLVFEADWAERAIEKLPGHDHRNPTQHMNRTTPNFQTIAWNPLITDYSGKTAGGHLCGDVAEKSDRRLAVTHSFVSDVAFVIVDVTNTSNPIKIGEYVLTNSHVYDLAITPDQRYVLLATDTGGQGEDPKAARTTDAAPSYFEDACTGQRHYFAGPETLAPLWEGVVLVDIRNPKAPVMSDYLFLGGGHSIQVRQLLERTLALVTTASFSLIEVTSDGKLRPVSSFLNCASGIAGVPVCYYHDGALQRHPASRQNLAYLANGNSLEVFSIDDPTRPQRVGGWSDWASLGEVSPSFLHEVLPMEELWAGRHYTFIGEECSGKPSKTPTCLIVLLDTTDIAHPKPVGIWTLPVVPQWDGGLMYSLHYIGYSNGTLFVTNYHGGLWAVDVSKPTLNVAMPTVGVFLPDRISPKPIGRVTSYDMTPAVLDVNPLSDGSLIAWDHTSGLYVLRFDASQPAPPPTPWKFK
jgi:hypothetical protein